MEAAAKIVRIAKHAGSWYTNDGAKLDKELSDNLAKAEIAIKEG